MAEITLFQGVALIVFASLTAIGWFLKIARDLERESESVVNEKASIVDEYFFKSLSAVFTMSILRVVKSLGQIEVGGKTILDVMKSQLEQYFDEMTKLKPKQLMEEIFNTELPSEILNLCRIGDEDRDRLFSISLLASQLKETPEIFSSMVDRMTKGVIFGIVCGILIGTLDLLAVFDLTQYFSSMVALVLLTGVFYFYYGILGIWTLRKLEKKLKELRKEKEIESIWETVMEVAEYG